MTSKSAKLPEIAIIVAMTESGLVGNGNKLPWKSSLDFEWFKKNTMDRPMIFGKNTANGMPVFPLKNRPCAIVTKSNGSQIVQPNGHGSYISFGPGQSDDSLGKAIRFFKNFDKIFIAGGISLYSHAMKMTQPWTELNGTPDAEKPLVDTIIKTVFPDGIVTGDKYLDKDTIKLMSEPHFKLVSHQDYTIGSSNEGFTNHTLYHDENHATISMPTTHKLGKNDTQFPTIRFEIWKRVYGNQGK
ncbi:MAG: dihydrofolate reductase [Alphaproteobacteria bacterium]|nr:dihydrofolate reductase [Alphaproteobacteria bacterium]MBN2675608.1 dihydrofolate reductase [Alphaproteobacteria bacterium]